MVSKVMFQDASVVKGLNIVESACVKHGAKLLVDVYHVLNAIPFSIKSEGLENSFLVGGGYKYLQLGEGNCFMRVPPNEIYKPVITGWFAEFADLSGKKIPGEVLYGKHRWAFEGSTYDPSSHYRAAKVFGFFKDKALTPALLRDLNNHQKEILREEFNKNDFPASTIKITDVKERAGFMTFLTSNAGIISSELRDRGILTDYRGEFLRFGPAPYLSDSQLIDAVSAMREIIKLL